METSIQRRDVPADGTGRRSCPGCCPACSQDPKNILPRLHKAALSLHAAFTVRKMSPRQKRSRTGLQPKPLLEGTCAMKSVKNEGGKKKKVLLNSNKTK